MTKKKNMIILDHLYKKYPSADKYSVEDISLSIPEGTVFGFLGPNGAGKTTTMKMMMGFIKPTQGEISINGHTPDSLESKHNIGFLPEHANLYQYLTGREMLTFCGEIFSLPKKVIEERIEVLIEKVHFPKEFLDKNIKKYSKGMQQRIGLAQALINDPKIVFLDEPMSGLDPLGRHQIKNLILGLKEEGKTIFFNSHILNDAETICEEIAIIHKGKIVLSGSIDEVTDNKKTPLEEIFVNTISSFS